MMLAVNSGWTSTIPVRKVSAIPCELKDHSSPIVPSLAHVRWKRGLR